MEFLFALLMLVNHPWPGTEKEAEAAFRFYEKLERNLNDHIDVIGPRREYIADRDEVRKYKAYWLAVWWTRWPSSTQLQKVEWQLIVDSFFETPEPPLLKPCFD